KDTSLVSKLRENTLHFRRKITELGLNVREGIHPIVPIIIGDTAKAIAMSKKLLERGVYVSGFGFPVVPQGQARLRCQISAAHSREQLDQAIEAIAAVAQEAGIV
ncbi:MAG: aminotransferase class I/II-fold pyridoxal phosphate-dependent enzyme, partial [Acidobacteria bacterium]|nr:aminotransferase class I/II-fold pyridoxal phosphate-dependent enzyme [Acidobacteriota bacterium]